MNLAIDVETLQAEHQQLERRIVSEMQRPAPDELHIQELKRQKLRIKDQIAELSSRAVA